MTVTQDETPAGMLGDLATVVRWDQRGCGRSQGSDGPWTTERFVADLDAVRRHFGLERIRLLGHSWGAQLALSYSPPTGTPDTGRTSSPGSASIPNVWPAGGS